MVTRPTPTGRLAATLAALCVCCTVTVGAPAAVAAAAAPTCPDGSPSGAQVIADTPWPQQRYDLRQITPLATGRGITVAVLDSGVDNRHPQLAGRVVPGADLLDGGDGRLDCVGHGTEVASIIAARGRGGSGLRGLAPDVSILPIRVTELRDPQAPATARDGTTADLATAIRTAVQRKADVINLSLSVEESTPGLRSAVAEAIDRGIVVVAAVGNGHDRGDPTPYPAAYPGVIGVERDQPGRHTVGRLAGRLLCGHRGAGLGRGRRHARSGARRARGHELRRPVRLRHRGTPSAVPPRAVPGRDLAQADRHGRSAPRAAAAPMSTGTESSIPYGPLPPWCRPRAPPPLPCPAWSSAPPPRRPPVGVRLSLAGRVAAGLVALAVIVAALAIAVPLGRRRRWRPGLIAPSSRAGSVDSGHTDAPTLAGRDLVAPARRT